VNPEDSNPLIGENILSLYSDSRGYLWVGTDVGLARLNFPSGELTQYRYDADDTQSLSWGQVNAIIEDAAGYLWIGTSRGLSRFDYDTETFTRLLFENNISDLYADTDGMVWIASNLGLFSWHPDSERFTVYQNDKRDSGSLSSNQVTAVEGDEAGNLWIGTTNGLNRYDPDTEKFLHFMHAENDLSSLSDNSITEILVDSRGSFWVGTINGLDLYNPRLNGFHHFQADPGIPSSLSENLVTALYEDQSGVIWIGTLSSGLNKLSDNHNRFHQFPSLPDEQTNPEQFRLGSSLHGAVINDLFLDKSGDLWIGTILNGLYRQDHITGDLTLFIPDQSTLSLSGYVVNVIFEDQSGQLWVGTDSDLNKYNPQVEGFETIPNFSRHSIEAIVQDNNNDLWVASSGGLFRLFEEGSELLIEKHSFADEEPTINDLFFDSLGSLWIATNDGVYVQLPGEDAFSHFTPDLQDPGSLVGHLATSIFEDRQGGIWIGTIFGGLNHFLPATKNFTSYTSKDGLSGEMVSCIQEDELGNLWLGTNRGLSQFDPREESFYNYDSLDGIQEGEFLSCTQAANGELYFGGLQGLNAFYPNEIERNEQPPPVVISQVYLFNQPFSATIEADQQLQLSYQQNFLAFDFAALDFHAPEKNQYAYMLEGLDQEWNQVGARRHAEYPDLEPGEYTFRVKAANNDGVWNQEGTAVHISILPPFWQTTWFQALAFIIIAGIVFAGYRLQVRRLQARSHELEAEVAARTIDLRERTREAEQRKAEIETLYQADEELYRYLHLDQVLNALLDTAIGIMNADKALLVVWDSDHTTLQVNNSLNYLVTTINQLEFSPGADWIGSVAVNGDTNVIEDAASHPGFPGLLAEIEQIHSSIQVPIKLDEQVFGVMSVDYMKDQHVTSQQLRLLEALAQRTALAIENARLYTQAQSLAAMQERNRIARDLHDSVSQSLFGASMFADTAEHQLSNGQVEQATVTINKMSDATRDALREMRLLIYELRPPILEEEGLAAAVVSRLETVEQRAGIQTKLNIEEVEGLDPDQEQQIYSIVIEALNNILKHARAEQVEVSLHQEGSRIQLLIEDDGTGFEMTTAREHGGLGLTSMEERAESLGANFDVESKPGQGTRLLLIMEIAHE